MATKVKTPYFEQFRMPGMCAGCGGGSVAGHHKVEISQQTSRKRTTTLKLDFPLCAHCLELADRKYGNAARYTLFGGLLFALGIFLFAGLGYRNFGMGLVVGLIVAIIFIIAANIVFRVTDFKGDEFAKRKDVLKSVKITQFKTPKLFDKVGSITFRFTNTDFANQFSQINLGEIV